MQQLKCKMDWPLSFYSLFKKALILRKFLGEKFGKCVKKCGKVRKSLKKCRSDFSLQLLPFSFSLLTYQSGLRRQGRDSSF